MNEEIIDVDFQEEHHESGISGKPLYYTTSQVGQMIGETDSTIRFWCTKFKDIIKPDMSGSHRRFREEDIDKLSYIKKLLREENYSINQVIEYAGEPNKNKIETQIQKQEPLAMQAIATAIAIEVGSQLEDYKLMIREELINELKNNKEEIKEYVALSIDNKLDTKLEDFKIYMDTQELQAKQRDDEMLALMKSVMDDRKRLSEELEKEKNKGLFKKIFGK